MRICRVGFVPFSFVLTVMTVTAPGADINWQNSSGGSFQDQMNWDSDVPGTGDTAIFWLDSAGYTVTFDANATNLSFEVRDDVTTFELNGFTYDLTDIGGSFVGWSFPGATGDLTLQNGTVNIDDGVGLAIGHGNGTNGTVTLRFTTTLNTSALQVGGAGNSTGVGELNVENNSTVEATGNAHAGRFAGTTGTINVRNNATLIASGTSPLRIGGFGDGTLLVDNNSTVNCVDLRVGEFAGSNGLVTVNADLNATGEVEIGKGDTAIVNVIGLFDSKNPSPWDVGPFGFVNVNSGGTLRTGGSVTPGGTTRVGTAAGGTATISLSTTGSNWEAYGPVEVGVDGPGLVDVSSESIVEDKDPFPWDVGPFGTVSVNQFGILRTGGTVTPGGTTTIGTASGGTATVNLLQGTWEFFGPVSIGEGGPASVTIDGGWLDDKNPFPWDVGPFADVDVVFGGTLRTGGSVTPGGTTTIGTASGGTANVSVTGTNSTWEIFGPTSVGTLGPALVTVGSGGLVDDKDPSPWGVGPDGDVNVNAGGTLRTGGSVTPGGTTTVGTAAGSTATVTIDGSGALWEIFGPLSVGEGGPGRIDVDNDGVFEGKDPDGYDVGQDGDVNVDGGRVVSLGTLRIGTSAAAGIAQVDVRGTGGTWESQGAVSIGEDGSGELTVSSGGLFESTDPSPLDVGPDGTVDVLAGGTLRTGGSVTPGGTTTIGTAPGGPTVWRVDGAGARWENYGDLHFGPGGFALMIVENGGEAVLGAGSGVDNVVFAGSGSGSPPQLVIENGGIVSAGSINNFSIGESGPAWIDIQTGGLFDSTDPSAWNVGPRGDVTVHAGSTLRTGGSVIPGGVLNVGTVAGADTATVTAEGAGAVWENFGDINVGSGGDGRITVENGAQMTLSGSGANNTIALGGSGSAEFIVDTNGVVEGGPGIINEISIGELGPATLTIQGGSLFDGDNPAPYDVGPDGLVTVAAGSQLITRGFTRIGTEYFGSDYISPARIEVVGAGARWDNHDELDVGGAGLAHVTIGDGGVIEDHGAASGDINLDGSIFGTGTMTGDFESVGRLYPGASAGTLTITGNFTQLADGELIIEIGGASAGEFDVVNVSGVATLDGLLKIERINSFVPTLGQTFTVMTYASRTGTFADVQRNSFGSGLTFRLDYNPTDLTLTVVDDCNFNGIPDTEDLSNCAGDPDCGDCNSNGIPDVCDIDQCDRAVDPNCSDCNNNDVPDTCDVLRCDGGVDDGTPCEFDADCDAGQCLGGGSTDLDLNDIPDECVFFTGGGATDNWTDGDNWDLGGGFPDNSAVTFSVTIEGIGSDVILDAPITIDSLNLWAGATLDVSGASLSVLNAVEVNGDTTGALRGALTTDLLIRGSHTVDCDDLHALHGGRVLFDDAGSLDVADTLTISADGVLTDDPDPSAVGAAGTIDAGAAVASSGSCAAGTFGGEVVLEDKMSMNVVGDFDVIGTTEPVCPGARGGITPVLVSTCGGGGGGRTSSPTLFVGGDMDVTDVAQVLVSSTCASRSAGGISPVLVTGVFNNQSTAPFYFDWSTAGIELTPSEVHTFEVAGRDLGPVEEGLSVQGCRGPLTPCGEPGTPTCGAGETCDTHTNGSFGAVTIGDGASVTFVDLFDNEDYVRGAPEALYVGTIVVGTGATVTVDDCSVYYRSIVPPEAADDVVLLGNARFEPLPTTVNAPGGADAPHNIMKNRYLSFTPLNSGVPNVAFQISLPDGRTGWLGAPERLNWGGIDEVSVSLVVDAPVFRTWDETTIHVTGCVIVPNESYAIRATIDGVNFTAPYNASTVPTPSVGSWADIVGAFDAGTQTWTPPNGFVNFNDIDGAVKKFQTVPTAPQVMVVDLHPQWPNYFVNFADIDMVIKGFQGVLYPVPVADCQTVANCPLGGEAPCLP